MKLNSNIKLLSFFFLIHLTTLTNSHGILNRKHHLMKHNKHEDYKNSNIQLYDLDGGAPLPIDIYELNKQATPNLPKEYRILPIIYVILGILLSIAWVFMCVLYQ